MNTVAVDSSYTAYALSFKCIHTLEMNTPTKMSNHKNDAVV